MSTIRLPFIYRLSSSSERPRQRSYRAQSVPQAEGAADATGKKAEEAKDATGSALNDAGEGAKQAGDDALQGADAAQKKAQEALQGK